MSPFFSLANNDTNFYRILLQYYSAPYQAVALSSLYHADSRDDTRVPKTLNMSIEYLEVEKCKSNLDTSTFPSKNQII